jgi:colicin import membrane protein
MSAEQSEVKHEHPTAIADVNTAVAKFDRVAAGIDELKTKYEGVLFDVTTTKGMKEATDARAAIRAPRYEVEKVRKECKAPILALGKEIDARAARITGELLALEQPVHQQITAEEARKEAERKAKIEAERARVAAIQDDIETSLRSVPGMMIGLGAALLDKAIQDVVTIHISAERFAEFTTAASAAKALTLSRLAEMHARQLAHEAEQQRLADERAELERQRIEQAAQADAERERIQAAVAAAEAERQRQVQEEIAKLRAEREHNQRIAREQREAAQAEQARIAAENARLAAEQRRQQEDLQRQQDAIAAQRAELERQQAELVKPFASQVEVSEPVAHITECPFSSTDVSAPTMPSEWQPSADELIWLVASEFGVGHDLAAKWLRDAFGVA